MSSAMVKLGDVINVHYGKALKADQRVSNGSVHVFGSSGIVGNHDKTLCSYPTIIIGRKGSVGAITWAPSGGWIIDTAYYVEIKDNNKLDLRYLFYILSGIDLTKKTITTSIPGLNRDDLYDTFISRNELWIFSIKLRVYAKNVSNPSNWLMIFCVLRLLQCMGILLQTPKNGLSILWEKLLNLKVEINHLKVILFLNLNRVILD